MSQEIKLKTISVIGTVGVPACYGGFESLVQNLIDYQSDDIVYRVYCTSHAYEFKAKKYNSADLVYVNIKANGISSVLYDITCLFHNLFRKTDVTLILGVSGCLFLPFYHLFSKSKIVTNIDGLEWKRNKWGKAARFFLKFSEKLAVKYSDVIIADNEAIGRYVKAEYGVASEIIAYGGDHALIKGLKPIPASESYFLTVCRIEPENNVSMILEAFSKTDKKIKFIGNWESSEFGKAQKEKYKKCPNIDLIDPIYDTEKLFELRAGCIGYVHGHSAGGTNPSLVEAMHFGMPIYAFDCDFNRYSTENKAFYFKTDNELSDIISSDLSKANTVRCGENMKEIAQRRYTWEVICNKYQNLY